MLLTVGCGSDAGGGLHVGGWHVADDVLEQEGARRGLDKCEASEALAEEELIRLEYCGRTKREPGCSTGDRAGVLAAAVEDAHQPPAAEQVAAVVAESRFLADREADEPGLSRKLTERRATRSLLRERAQIARRRVRVRLPAGCERRPVHAAR